MVWEGLERVRKAGFIVQPPPDVMARLQSFGFGSNGENSDQATSSSSEFGCTTGNPTHHCFMVRREFPNHVPNPPANPPMAINPNPMAAQAMMGVALNPILTGMLASNVAPHFSGEDSDWEDFSKEWIMHEKLIRESQVLPVPDSIMIDALKRCLDESLQKF